MPLAEFLREGVRYGTKGGGKPSITPFSHSSEGCEVKLSCSCCLLPSHNHTPGYKLICANLQQYILQSRDSGVIKPRWKAIASFCHSELLGKWQCVRGRGGVQIAACSWLWPKTKLIHRFRSIPNPLSLDYQCTFLTDDDGSAGGNVIGDGVGFIGSGLEVVEEERGAGRDEAGRYCWLDSSDDDLSGSKSHYTLGWKAETRAQRCSWVMEWRCGVLSLLSPRNWWKCIKRATGDCVSRPCRAKQPSAVSIQVSLKYPTNLIAAQDHLVIVGLEQGQERNRLSVHLNQNI